MKQLKAWLLGLNPLAVNLILVGLSWLGSAALIRFTHQANPYGFFDSLSLMVYFLLLCYNLAIFYVYLWLDSQRSDD